MKKFLLVFLLVLLAGCTTFSAQDAPEILCDQGLVTVQGNQVKMTCVDTPTDTPTDTPVPTDIPTDTPANTPTNAPTDVPTNVPGPYAGAPLCPTHDDREYHGLWDYERGCHYDHEHGDDPHIVDDVFGTDLFEIMGGEISYPWETTMENHHKHSSYKWFAEKQDTCYSRETDGCIKAYRALAHMDSHNVASDYHSFVIEAQVCREGTDDCGIYRVGGWQYVGDLFIDQVVVYDRDERTHAPRAPRPVFLYHDKTGVAQFSSWYPTSPMGWARVATEFGDMWGHYEAPANPPVSSPSELNWIPHCYNVETGLPNPGCLLNNSRRKPEIIGLGLSPFLLRAIGQTGTHVSWEGFVDRYGNVVQCTEIGVDCIPVLLDNVRTDVQFQWNGDYRDHDIYFNNQPSGWLTFPN